MLSPSVAKMQFAELPVSSVTAHGLKKVESVRGGIRGARRDQITPA